MTKAETDPAQPRTKKELRTELAGARRARDNWHPDMSASGRRDRPSTCPRTDPGFRHEHIVWQLGDELRRATESDPRRDKPDGLSEWEEPREAIEKLVSARKQHFDGWEGGQKSRLKICESSKPEPASHSSTTTPGSPGFEVLQDFG
jgi:hypothetical protein